SFFDPENVEILVKVLDASTINGHFWVYYASLSNVQYEMRVRETRSGAVRVYRNPLGRFASGGDAFAFPAGALASPSAGRKEGAGPAEKSTTLELQGGRFTAAVRWTDFDGNSDLGTVEPLTDDSGAFWFFDEGNVELVVKILDARSSNGHFWVFYGAMSNVAFTLEITDTVTGVTRRYENELGEFASRGDVEAF
ncbi:MAG: hypothetical protein MI919_42670, partial [Holophagales bacterium]|nr:hypothetical protein [Holophagales bacterium]